jgi:predicted nucleic acid-binding Zn ribbon protein
MRKTNQQSIGQVLSQLIKENKLEGRLQEVELVSTWKKIVGDYMSKHTTDIKIHKGVLYIAMDSPACREELMYRRTELLAEINKTTGSSHIKEIVIR